MAWTSSALSFLLPGVSKPVIVTGSQLPLFYKTGSDASQYQLLYNTDAVRNVLGAIRYGTMSVPEVGLYFADHLFRGNRVVKSNASEFVAFSSPNYPPLGEYGVLPELDTKQSRRMPGPNALENRYEEVGERLDTIAAHVDDRSVLQLQLFPAPYSAPDGSSSLLVSMLTHIKEVDPPLAGLIFEAYGEGNIPDYRSMKTLLTSMRKEDDIVLVDCTQVFAGDVNYNAYATGAWLNAAGVISGHDMTPIAALAKLIVLRAAQPSASAATLETQMGRSLAGELTPYYELSGYQNEFLAPGESLFSVNGSYQFQNKLDGTLALFDVSDPANPKQIWSAANPGAGRLVMQSDNNLVFYTEDGSPTWATDTPAIGHNSVAALKDDGSLVLCDLDTGEPRTVVIPPASSGATSSKAGAPDVPPLSGRPLAGPPPAPASS
jgi:L-asparaginase